MRALTITTLLGLLATASSNPKHPGDTKTDYYKLLKLKKGFSGVGTVWSRPSSHDTTSNATKSRCLGSIRLGCVRRHAAFSRARAFQLIE